jgi:hypothetical protein
MWGGSGGCWGDEVTVCDHPKNFEFSTQLNFSWSSFSGSLHSEKVFLSSKSFTMELQVIRRKIYEIRGQKVMLDYDLAELYGVETKALNQAVKRNIERFPEDFMFRLTEMEWMMRSQFVTASEGGNWSQIVTSSDEEPEVIDNQTDGNSSQIVTSSEEGMRSQIVTSSQQKRKKGVTPFAFTEHGVSMLASVLRSEKAVQMSISIVRAFIALKQYVVRREGLAQHLRVILDRLDEHDVQLNAIYDAIENLLDEKVEEKAEEHKWEERERIGFKK